MKKETRSFHTQSSKLDDTDGGKIIEGHAVVFDSPTWIGGKFIEVIDRNALNGCDLSDVSLLVNHDGNSLPLARTTSSTLSLSVDNIGLAIRAKLDVENNPLAKVLYSAVSRGDCRGMSFAFTVADGGDKWQGLDTTMPTRVIKRIKKIYECSAVTLPAYPQTDLQARAKEILQGAFEKEKGAKKMTNYDRELLIKHGFNPDEKDEEERRRNLTQARITEANYVNEELRRANEPQPPKFIPGIGFINNPYDNMRFIPIHEGGECRINSAVVEQREQAGRDLKENRVVQSPFDIFGERRTMTVGTTSVVIPDYSSQDIKPDFSVVSSLVDEVAHLALQGGNSFKQPYITGIDTGGYTAEGADYTEAETQFDFATINRVKITAYAELTEELRKLPEAAYAEIVFNNIRTSIRKILTQEILFGAGISNNQNRIVGIFSDLATAIDPNTDLSLSTINDKTLAKIIFSYGSDEEVESTSCLILNKLDLLAFDDVRTANQTKFYDIQYSGNGASGKINGVNFIVNSACKPLTDANTQSGDYCMAYGNLSNYLLCDFAPIEVERSDDYKFRKGITCFRGSAIVGGNVVRKNGFIRVKKE